MARRRFGVSLPETLAARLDELSKRLGVPRSALVEEAVENLVRDYGHLATPHQCLGVVLVTGLGGRLDAQRLLEEYRDVVRSSSHHHAGGTCLELVVVEGPSERIAGLLAALRSAGCRARFTPLHSHEKQPEPPMRD